VPGTPVFLINIDNPFPPFTLKAPYEGSFLKDLGTGKYLKFLVVVKCRQPWKRIVGLEPVVLRDDFYLLIIPRRVFDCTPLRRDSHMYISNLECSNFYRSIVFIRHLVISIIYI